MNKLSPKQFYMMMFLPITIAVGIFYYLGTYAWYLLTFDIKKIDVTNKIIKNGGRK